MNMSKKNGMKILLMGMLSVGIAFSQFVVTGEFNTDVTFGDDVAFTSPYTGLSVIGDKWEMRTELSDGGIILERSYYKWNTTDKITTTFGLQETPYGVSSGFVSSKVSENPFVSSPRSEVVKEGVGIQTSAFGVGINGFYGNGEYWAGRLSYKWFDYNVGFSFNSDEVNLIDVSTNVDLFGLPITSAFEYTLGDDSGYWVRCVVTPNFAKGAYILSGYNSDEEVTYGVGYKCSDSFWLASELSADGDTMIRLSYSF